MSFWDRLKMEILGWLRFQPTGLGIISSIEYEGLKAESGASTFSDMVWGVSGGVGKAIDDVGSAIGDAVKSAKNYLIFGLVFLALFFVFREFWRVKSAGV